MVVLLNDEDDEEILICDQVMFELMYGCGLCLNELILLNVFDFIWDYQVWVIGKGNKQWLLLVGKKVYEVIVKWFEVRCQWFIKEGEFVLFISK